MVGQQPGALVVRVQQVGADGQDATGPENIGGKSGRNLDPEKTPFSRKTLEVSLDYAYLGLTMHQVAQLSSGEFIN